MPTVTRNKEMEKEVYDACRKLLDKDRSGTHVSDLLSPRQTFLRKKFGNRISDKQVGLFIAGIAHHGIIESLVAAWDDREIEQNMEGIYASIDCARKGLPVEVKTSRAWQIDSVSKGYIEQLQMYCVISGTTSGHVLIFYLNVKLETENEDGTWDMYKGPIIVCHDVSFTIDELKDTHERMINNKKVIEEAVYTGDGSKLPKCDSWKCPDCQYKVECKDIDKPRTIQVGNLVMKG